MRYATEKFVADWYNSMDKFFLTNLSRLMEQSAGMYNGQIKDIFVKNLGCDKECIEKRINNVSKWTRGLWNYCPCKNLQDLPFVEQEEAETLESGDFYLVSMPEWIELASQVTEEEYNTNPFAEQLNNQFGNPFERGLFIQAEEQVPEAEEAEQTDFETEEAEMPIQN